MALAKRIRTWELSAVEAPVAPIPPHLTVRPTALLTPPHAHEQLQDTGERREAALYSLAPKAPSNARRCPTPSRWWHAAWQSQWRE